MIVKISNINSNNHFALNKCLGIAGMYGCCDYVSNNDGIIFFDADINEKLDKEGMFDFSELVEMLKSLTDNGFNAFVIDF